jgi:hypothetical protein
MFKFYARGDDDNFEGGVFLNGQKILSFTISRMLNDEFDIDVMDGSDAVMCNWSDFEESD